MNKEKILFMVRGVPGSGKSSVAEEIAKGYPDVICCADDYHMIDGEYKWELARQGYAHKSCQAKCENLMKCGVPRVVVSNTSTTVKEMKPYYDMAATYGYSVFSLVVENRHGGKDIHNVPEASLEAMEKRFDIKLR
ncbi:MAG: AAA family ATPase [Candidatus Pacearchaeota archaeon]|jgi:predicted kinase|nr:ATP-binding protein [Clostridia bacterium]